MFIQKSVSDETISQYKVQGSKLVNSLITFIKEEYSQQSQLESHDDDESGDEADIVDELLKIKNDKRGTNSLLDRLRETCGSLSLIHI